MKLEIHSYNLNLVSEIDTSITVDEFKKFVKEKFKIENDDFKLIFYKDRKYTKLKKNKLLSEYNLHNVIIYVMYITGYSLKQKSITFENVINYYKSNISEDERRDYG